MARSPAACFPQKLLMTTPTGHRPSETSDTGMECQDQDHGCRSEAWAQVLAVPLPSCVTLESDLTFLSFLLCKM